MAEMENMKYEEALGRLEKIVAEIENPQTAVGDIPADAQGERGKYRQDT